LPDEQHALSKASEIRLFSKCRNELLRLPAFLEHYRRLGVDRFYFADNESSDGTTRYLTSQPDAHVFATTGRFREARGGTEWLNALMARFGVGHWCVNVDVDELLVYPGSESATLPKLTAFLESSGHQALSCMLLDMYPGGSLEDVSYRQGEDLISSAPYFDPGPYERIPIMECPGVLIRGGVRERVFYPEFRDRSFADRIYQSAYHRIVLNTPVLGDLEWIKRRRPGAPPALTKVPLVRWDYESQYLDCNHTISPMSVAPESGVLLHFKFLQDFHARAVEGAARGEYYGGATEYRRYAAKLHEEPRMTLKYERSVQLTDPVQLTELGLMRDTQAWTRARSVQERAGESTR
jgi:hypothetical protein